MRSDSLEVSNTIELLGLLLEESKRNLVKCDPEKFLHAQGEAYAYDRMLRMLSRSPITEGMTEE